MPARKNDRQDLEDVERPEEEDSLLDLEDLQQSMKDLQLKSSQLLQRTSLRRISVIPDQGENLDPATDPWDINTIPELSQFVERDPAAALRMIQLLREERDAGIHNTAQLDQCTQLLGHYEKQHSSDQSKILELEREQKKVAIRELHEEDFTKLQDQITALKRENKDLKRQPRSQTQGLSSTTHKSTKLPHPPVFTGMPIPGQPPGPSWNEWYTKMHEKLTVNKDHFPTIPEQIAYTASRLGGDADRITLRRRQPDARNAYTSLDDIFKHLAGLYKDQHERSTAEREFEKLAMTTEGDFRSFFYEFSRLIEILGYGMEDDHTKYSIKKKLPDRLRERLYGKTFDTMDGLSNYLFLLDDDQRADWKMKHKETPRKAIASPRREIMSTALVPRTTTVAIRNQLQPSPDMKCYTCGKTNCLPSRHEPGTLQTPAGRAAQLAAQASKVREIDIHETAEYAPEDSGLDDQLSPDEDSKNE